MEYFFPDSENTVRQTDSLLKVTLPLPKGALPLQNKLEYYITLMHTQCTLLCSIHCSTAPIFNVVLHTIQTFLCCTAKQTTQIGHSLSEYPYNAFRKQKVFNKTNELNSIHLDFNIILSNLKAPT